MPYVIMLMLIPTGRLFDWLRSTGRFRLITLRKMYNTIGKSTEEFLNSRRFVLCRGCANPPPAERGSKVAGSRNLGQAFMSDF